MQKAMLQEEGEMVKTDHVLLNFTDNQADYVDRDIYYHPDCAQLLSSSYTPLDSSPSTTSTVTHPCLIHDLPSFLVPVHLLLYHQVTHHQPEALVSAT